MLQNCDARKGKDRRFSRSSTAWELKGRYPQILDDADKGVEARNLFADAKAMLKQLIAENWLQARAVIGLFLANSTGDDIEVYRDEQRKQVLTTLHNLRKQGRQPRGKFNECLADFVAPKGSGKADYIGGFACTAGQGIDAKLAEFAAEHDDYQSIMLKALAEMLHRKVRTELWGNTADEQLDNRVLIDEQYSGIRPAMGYPASPDHTEKDLLWDLLNVKENTGIWLTESKAMAPTASVSGLYIAHPDAR